MEMQYYSTENGESANITSGYQVLYSSATTDKVNITQTVSDAQGQIALQSTAWMLRNGTVIAVLTEGQNLSGSAATSSFDFAMTLPNIEASFSYPSFLAQIANSTYHVRAVNQTTVTVGGTTLNITNYEPVPLPVIVQACGMTATYTEYIVQVGVPKAAAMPLISFIDYTGTVQSTSGIQPSELIFKIVSLTQA